MLYDLIEQVVMWLYALPPFPVVMVLGILLGLPTTVIHELGHGIAANVVAKVPVKIEISLSGLDWARRVQTRSGLADQPRGVHGPLSPPARSPPSPKGLRGAAG